MRSINILSLAELDDEELVTRSLAGGVEAFREISGRYYPIISALAYQATGSLSRSDSVAQDTLVAAWKRLAGLPAPAKLRSWLCGIAHQLIKDFLCDKGAGQAPSWGGKAALTFHCAEKGRPRNVPNTAQLPQLGPANRQRADATAFQWMKEGRSAVHRYEDEASSSLHGCAAMTPRGARLVLETFDRQNAVQRNNYGLSAREKEVLELMIKDLIKKEIAERLGLSYHTVNNHLRSIYDRLHVHTRSGAVAKALGEELL